MDFRNCYEDEAYAASYAKLEFPGTYYLAFRDLPDIFDRHVHGRKALDFGCGTGRSTRFLRQLGFEVMGVDVASEMVRNARSIDSESDYRLVKDGDLAQFAKGSFDLILSAFTFDNIPTLAQKVTLFAELRRILRIDGRIVNLVSAPEIYWHEWASFSTKDFPENCQARCGDHVRIIVTALEDRRPAVDVLWPDEDYRDLYARAGLTVLDVHRPLGRPDEPHQWVSETTTAPWTVYTLGVGTPVPVR
jgi:SAM-dependent methyltransferase